MTDFNLPAYQNSNIGIDAHHDNDTVTLALAGNADIQALEPLESIFPRLHAEAIRLDVREVTVDLQRLDFINSSCIKAFVNWIAMDQNESPTQQYRIRFVLNAKLHWQRRTINALMCFAPRLVQVAA